MLQKTTKNIPKPTNFGKNLKFLRRLNALSQLELANRVGKNRNNIASYESGIVEPDANKYLEICDYFTVDPKEMLDSIFSENPQFGSPIAIIKEIVGDSFVSDKMEGFVTQTNEMTKIYEGYKTFYQLKKQLPSDQSSAQFYTILDDLLELLKSLIESNWEMIQSVYTYEEE